MLRLYQLVSLLATISLVLSNPFTLDKDKYTDVLQLKCGKVRGFVQEEDDIKVNFFEGIRYGHYERRFELAEPYTWSGVYDAVKTLDACPQPGYSLNGTNKDYIATTTMSEDCLYLNVFQPTPVRENRTVMVWIHGGGFVSGTIFTRGFDGSYLAQMGDVILVTVNYRLGPFGFLYSSDQSTAAPGNQGLHDQVLALKWVRDNIQHFGGNPNDVTVFGESAGSMSVGALYLSPLTKGLFHRAIMQSGAPNAYLGSTSLKEASRRTNELAKNLNCDRDNLPDSIKCIRNKTVFEVLDGCKNALLDSELMIPVYGDNLMPVNPVHALKSGLYNSADLMFGITRNEGTGFVIQFFKDFLNNNFKLTLEKTKGYMGLLMMLFGESNGADVAEYYTKNVNASDPVALKSAVSDVFGDYHLVCPTILYGEEVARSNKVHHYYAYRLMQQLGPVHNWLGVTHGQDIAYIFALPLRVRGLTYTSDDKKLSRDMIHAWTTFAKTGSIGTINNITEWKETIDPAEKDSFAQLMGLDAENYQMIKDYFKDKCDNFWKPVIFKEKN